MKKLLLILLYLPMIGFGQLTYVPDDVFEDYLENNGMGNGIANDDYVWTSAIDSVNNLAISTNGILNLIGLEDFISLERLYISNNPIMNLDISNNTNLHDLIFASSLTPELTSLNVQNGNNLNLKCDFITPLLCGFAVEHQNLHCIQVDDVSWANLNWLSAIDTSHQYFSLNCSTSTSIKEQNTNKELIKTIDLLGRETKKTNQPLLYIYDDGTVEKRIALE